MSTSIEYATFSGPLSSPDNSYDPSYCDALLSYILSSPNVIDYSGAIGPQDACKSPPKTFAPELAPVYPSTYGYGSQSMPYIPAYDISDTHTFNPIPEDPFSSSYDAFMSSPPASGEMLSESHSSLVEEDFTRSCWPAELQTSVYPLNSSPESLTPVPTISVFEPVYAPADLHGEFVEDSFNASSGSEFSLSSNGSISDYSSSPRDSHSHLLSPAEQHVYPISRPRSTSMSSEASASSPSSSGAVRARRARRRRGNSLQQPSSSPVPTRTEQAPPGTPYPDRLLTFDCPMSFCNHHQKNHRMPDLRRHVNTHFAESRRIVCCGVPIQEAERFGITDLSMAEHWPELGRVTVGGCKQTFGRLDVYRRHLRAHKGRCFGDASKASWVSRA